MRKIRKNDTVRILVGKDRGKTGKVLAVVNGGQKVKVEKCNVVKRHKKPDSQHSTGGIIEMEAPLHISNVALIASDGATPVRVGFQVKDGGAKVRYSRKHDQIFD